MTDMKLFSYNGADVRTVIRDNAPWFIAAEVCRILDISNSRDAVSRLDDDEKDVVLIDTLGGPQQMSIVNEAGLYTLILGSRKPEARAFKRWVTHEVIPSIRRYGMYAVDELLNDPDLAIAMLTQLKEEREKRRALELTTAMQKQQILELQPKASYYDLVLQSKDAVPISLIAKDYGMSAKWMNKMLHQMGIQYKLDKVWLLYQKYADQGYTQSKTYALDDGRSKMHTYWTQKGRLFLYQQFKDIGILPLIEQEVDA